MHSHECKRDELKWATEPVVRGDYICFVGKCPKCGKEYEQVFTANDDLWDVQEEQYVSLG